MTIKFLCTTFSRKRRKRRKPLLLVISLLLFLLLVSLSYSGDNITICTDLKQNVMYIKMIKCASETLSSVFRRYAHTRNLSVVLPLDNKIYLGWPHKMDHHSYRPTKTGVFNFLVDHAVFDEDFMSELMPEDTMFVTSIREPFAQFRSMFAYYKLALNSNMSHIVTDELTEYIQNIEKYESVYKSHEMSKNRFCIPDHFSMSKNLMSFNLGFAAGKPDGALDGSKNQDSIQYFLANLESKFKLVMLVEYFDESMVLLRRIMCWELKDILYHKRNVGQYVTLSQKLRVIEEANIKIYKDWSNVDYQLYEHFLNIFWQKVKDEGLGFYVELQHYRKINKLVNNFCMSMQADPLKASESITIAKSAYGSSFVVDNAFCNILTSALMEESKKYYDSLPRLVKKVTANKYYC